MYFWAEKYFSGSGEQSASGSGARRTSRSGSGEKIDRKGSFLTETAEGGQHTQRKSVGGAGGGGGGGRRESRERERQHEKSAEQKQQQPKGGRKNTTSGLPRASATPASATVPPAQLLQQHRASTTLSELAAAAAAAAGGAPSSAAGSASGSAILLNIARALAVRALLMSHALLCIWAAGEWRGDNSVWAFGLLAVCLVGEGFYAVVVRAGDDPKWFSPAILLYLCAAVPPLWLVNASSCSPSASSSIPANNSASDYASLGLQPHEHAVPQQLLHYSLFLVLLAARWLLPRAELSREELTQVLLAYVAIGTDILEFCGLLHRHAAALCAEHTLHTAVLGAWCLSLAQFALVLTASRARKARIALATKIIVHTSYRPDFRQAFYDVDIWTVLISLALQDIPFLLVRLGLIAWLWRADFPQLVFLGKNALIILLQSYRISVLLNDRYLNPPLDARARTLIEERRQSMVPGAAKGPHAAKMSLALNSGAGGNGSSRGAAGPATQPGTMAQKQQ